MTAARKGGGYVAVAQEIEQEAPPVDWGNGHDDSDESWDFAAGTRHEASAPTGDDKPAAPQWHRMPALVDVILSRASDPLVALRLGDDEIASVRLGASVVVMGPTGGGKTSLVAGLLVPHARERGPVVVLSRELPADELAARAIGMQCDASWLDVLTGKVPRAFMEQRANLPRMVVLERQDANLGRLEEAIKAMQAEYPGQPVLVACDYVQIIDSAEKEVRAKVADVIAQIDEIARGYRVVVLVISQMSRAASNASRAGEKVGALSTDAGAESAAIERAATLTLAIGAAGPDREDGTRTVDLSIGKSRMGGGDRVLPMSYCGRSGRWRVEGESRPTVDVLAERAAKTDTAKVETAKLAMLGFSAGAKAPFDRETLISKARCAKAVGRAAVEALLESGAVVEVQRKKARSSAWLLWTPDAAAAGEIAIVGGDL